MTTEAQQKGEHARQLLANPVFQEAFDGMLSGITDAIADAPIEDANLRNQLGLQIAAAAAFKVQLFDVIETAKLEADEDARQAPGES